MNFLKWQSKTHFKQSICVAVHSMAVEIKWPPYHVRIKVYFYVKCSKTIQIYYEGL